MVAEIEGVDGAVQVAGEDFGDAAVVFGGAEEAVEEDDGVREGFVGGGWFVEVVVERQWLGGFGGRVVSGCGQPLWPGQSWPRKSG